MAEELALCRMEVFEFVEVMRHGERVPLDPGIYDVGLAAGGTVDREDAAAIEDLGWIVEIGGARGGVLSEGEIDEAERLGHIRWL